MADEVEPPQSELHNGTRGVHLRDVHEDTRVVASRLHQPKCATHEQTQPVVPPIQTAATYRIPTDRGAFTAFEEVFDKGGYFYSRHSNPTIEAAEVAINALEGGAGTLCYSSGVAAIISVFTSFVRPGDHIVSQNPVYSGTYKLLTKYLPSWKVDVTFVKPDASVDDYRRAVRPNTKVSNASCSQGTITVVDSTYATPYLLKPLKFGIDIALHSGTKYLGGHLDLIAGVVSAQSVQHWRQLRDHRSFVGNMLSPWDSFLLLRGVRSLHVRMDRHCDNAEKIAKHLSTHSKIAKVYYPGLESNSGHKTACQQMKRFGGMITFDVKGGMAGAKVFLENVRLIEYAVSLGGINSLVEHVTVMSHGKWIMTSEDRESGHLSDGLIRFSVGLEDVQDIIADLDQALDKVKINSRL